MSKKIGRNDPCPCGSGKKNKKCCKVINGSSEDTNSFSQKNNYRTFEYIETNNSKQLLDFIIGLQLKPSNHGKNVRIEELAKHIVLNMNTIQNGDLNLFKKHLDKEFSFSPMEDLSENLYCENVVFYGGNYTVFSGINGYAVEIFKNLTETIFTQKNNLPKKFKHHVFSGVILLLELGKILAKKFGINGNIEGDDNESKFDFSFNSLDTSFSQEEVNQICQFHNIDIRAIMDFVVDLGDKEFSNNDLNKNPLLFYPIVYFENKYYFVLITNQVNALNEFIIRLSNQYNCNSILVELYHNKLWHEHWGACREMGWQLIDIDLPLNNHPTILKERIFQFDTNRLAYSCYIHNGDEDNSSSNVFDINQRINEVITSLKKITSFKDYKFLSLITFENMGHDMFFGIESSQKDEVRLTFPMHAFNILCYSENWNKLSLWKFGKSYELFSKTTNSALTDTLDIYSIYKSKNESFYFGDNARPNYLTILPGDGSHLIKEAKIKKNTHGILSKIKGKYVYIPSVRYADYAPLYEPLHRLDYYAICLETFDFPLWIVNYQVKNKEIKLDVRTFAEAVAFWLFKLSPEISCLLNPVIVNYFEIEIVIEDNIFETKSTKIIVENNDDSQYSHVSTANNLKFTIPFSKIKTFTGSNNVGEREMMKAILNAFNNVKGISISQTNINQFIDKHIPLGQAKMILLSDSHQDPLIDNRWIIKPFYISNTEIERILDEVPTLIEKTKKIPIDIEKELDKKELFNNATKLLLDTLSEEIKYFEFELLLKELLELYETLIWKREQNKTLIPAQLLCFGNLVGESNEILENENKLVKTSLATRCLIEYIAARPIKGLINPGLDEIDRLLALMYEITNYGFLSDAIHFKLANPTVGKLKSGRIGISKEFFDEKIKPFAKANTKEEIDNYLENFENRFKILTFSDDDKEKIKEDEEIKKIDLAFSIDWGISYLNIYKFCFAFSNICINNECSVFSGKESELLQILVNEYQIPEKEAIQGIERFSISKRDEYLKAPVGYNDNEVFPWKYNREFSFARRFIIKHQNKNGEILLTWGFRNAISAQKQLHYLLLEGKLNNGGINIDKLLGTFRTQKGKQYRKEVKDWLKKNKDLIVIDYEVDISPNGHLKAVKKYGDIDILVFDPKTNVVYSFECKDTNKAKNIHEMKKEMDNYLGREGQKGMIQKHVDRHNWLNDNANKLYGFLKIETEPKIISLMLTSEVIPTTYIKEGELPLPILSFPDLKREGLKLLDLLQNN